MGSSERTSTHDYPPADWNRGQIETILREAPRGFPIPRYADEAQWSALRRDERTAPSVEQLLEEAEAIDEAGVPALPASAYLEYFRSGTRPPWEDPALSRISNLDTLVVAECVDRSGRFQDAIIDHAWALCDEATWVMHALLPDEHRIDGLPRQVPIEEREIGLRSTGVGRVLAETAYVLGDELHSAVHERIERNVEGRILTPYEEREDLWWLEPETMPNQNAVNHFGVLTAAMYQIQDVERLAGIIEKAVRSLRHYLDGFHADGGTDEGVGYWDYGFGHYGKLAAQLQARTDGELSLLSPPVIEEIAQFPLRVQLSPGYYPAFSDAKERVRIDPAVGAYLGHELDLPALSAMAERSFREGSSTSPRALHWIRDLPDELPDPTPPRSWYFPGIEWWIARANPAEADGLAVAAKAGHNGESHNHNDCGSVVVHLDRESLLTDLGRATYHSGLKGKGRYEYLNVRSLGHPVPYVNGTEQAAGAEFSAEVIDHVSNESREAIEMDLTGCYPAEAGLESLVRRIALHRDPAWVRLEDTARFQSGAPDRELVSVLTSFSPIRVAEDGLAIEGDRGSVRVSGIDPDSTEIEYLDDAMEVAGHYTLEEEYRDVYRARVPATHQVDEETRTSRTVEMTIRP